MERSRSYLIFLDSFSHFLFQASQYATHISCQAPRVEIVAALEEAMTSLLATFRQRNNGTMPQHLVVYRAGVGDGQFNEVLDRELPCIQNALAAMVSSSLSFQTYQVLGCSNN